MSEISDFEARITAALERIGRAVAVAEERAETIAAEAAGGIASEELEAEIARLRDALDEEKAANSQLETRVKAIHERQETHVAALETEVETLRRQLADHDREMQKLRLVNTQLRENNTALREANAEGLGNADLIDSGMRAELEALKVTRAADVTELDAILTELRVVMARQQQDTETVSDESASEVAPEEGSETAPASPAPNTSTPVFEAAPKPAAAQITPDEEV
ncbi:hypothetical protein [Celeribacter halophilus]|uniref:Uncharacterized protein n=1 Tax=Celeribacter halophilus TaxID=576117 RepID=A0A1I3NVM9_9RHOB|nr:hypothetical protein [Celeribacter halophilus]PZX14661.1 hypothetical protein LX82_00451 [Celeribacter halophilus]SFJ13333.1 hypothetical protein SAMN04488138_102100 [Celeribacter halophilus]